MCDVPGFSVDCGGSDGAGHVDCSGTLLVLQQTHFASLLWDATLPDPSDPLSWSCVTSQNPSDSWADGTHSILAARRRLANYGSSTT